MKFMSRLMRRFARGEDGSLIAEAVIVLPMLIWAHLALFVYWDVFRSMNTVQKASYSVADLISRQSEVNVGFIDGMQQIMTYLIDSNQTSKMRMTSVQWDATTAKYKVLWSRSPGAKMPALTDTTVQSFSSRIPTMANGHSVILVETFVDYVPAFDAGVNNKTIEQFIVTRPRYYLRICMNTGCPV